MWAKWHMSDTKKSLPQSLFLQMKGHYEVPLKKKIPTKLSGFNDNYNLHMIYIIIIWFILLLLHYTQALLV